MTSAIATRISNASRIEDAMAGASAMGATDMMVALVGVAELTKLRTCELPPKEYAAALNVYLARAAQIRNNAVYAVRGNA